LGPDAHAKNYSLLIEPRVTRLAPLYDITSVLPYKQFSSRKVKLAMKIGGKYRAHEIGLREWEKTSRALAMDAVGHVRDLTRSLPDVSADLLRRCKREGLEHPVLRSLADAIARRARTLA